MNKPQHNHTVLVTKIKTILIENNIFNDNNQPIRFEVPAKRTIYHLIIRGIADRPICIKTAYAESFSSNQARGYPDQIEDMPKDMDIWFIYDGIGFNHDKYKRCKSKIKKIIGIEQVMSVEQFKHRVIKLIKKAPKR